MNRESKLIFIVGPGGVGKTTAGEVLAEEIGYAFVDLDREFLNRVGLIGDYVREHGYSRYCETNSRLFEELVREWPSETVFPLSSGFLVHEDSPELVKKHKKLLQKLGVSVLLLPSESLQESLKVVVPRQLSRGYIDTTEENEIERHRHRYPKYKEYGDVKIFSKEEPRKIAARMIEGLKLVNFRF